MSNNHRLLILPLFQSMFQDAFEELAPICADACCKHVSEARIPGLGQVSIELAFQDASIASCLTATRANFANMPHCDSDMTPFTYGVWLTTRKDGTLVVDNKECEDVVNGGEFFWANYGVAARFRVCPGLIELIWHGKDDRHGTALSKTQPDYQQWGTSVQVSGQLK
jgi:hypothetical protein